MDKPQVKTLKEKWNDHWENRKFSPPQEQANLAGVCFFWLFTIALLLTTLLLAIPHHYNDTSKFWANTFVFFIFIESVVNWILCLVIKNNVSTKTKSHLENGQTEEWKMCLVCQKSVPPRAHHCKICKACVLKRDHHCFFTGVCVGFNNQRNFIVYTFYIVVGSIYGIYLLSHYLGQFYNVWSHEGWTFIPFVAFWKFGFGYLPIEHFALMLQMYLCVAMTIVAGYFFLWQMAVVISGRTTYEVSKCIKKYQGKGILNNLRSVFGPFYLLQFIVPIPTALLGDGTHWNLDNSSKWQ